MKPPCFVYILQSATTERFYIGCSHAPDRRLIEHNLGKTVSTRNRGPWHIVWQKKFDTEQLALLFERDLKRKKSAKYLRWIIKKSD